MNRATSATGWARNPDGTLGYTWNPITGCNNQIDGMCQGGNFPCYAYRLANGRLRNRCLANKHTATQNYDEDSYPFYPRLWLERISEMKPLFHRKEKGIFVCDMSDLFGIGIPDDWISQVLFAMKVNPWHRFYLLTKQPQNLIKFSPFPDNCWVGVTVTKPEFLFPALDALDSIQCSVRYLSIEPMLAAFDVPDLSLLLEGSVDWLILGSQTKPYKPPKIEWVEEIVRACDKVGVKVFLKDNLRTLILDAIAKHQIDRETYLVGRDLRQEIPVEIPL